MKKQHVESLFYRWGMAALAGVAALAISTGGGGSVSSAATAPGNATIAHTASDSGAPGTDQASIDAQNRASAALLGMETASTASGASSAQAGDGPGGQLAPEATCPILPCFTDVPSGYTFYEFINRIYQQDLVTGYACGGAGEPCNSEGRPYYRPGAGVTRGQMSKFIDNARRLAGIFIEAGYTPIVAKATLHNGAGLLGLGVSPRSAGVAGYGQATGLGRTIDTLNVGVYAGGQGADNSVGLIAIGDHDNGAWIGSQDNVLNSYGVYVVDGMNGLGVGGPGDDPGNNSFIGGDLQVEGNCTGCELVVIMQNTGDSDLHPGEVAAMTSAPDGPSQIGDAPLVGADRSQGAYSTSVAGVVYHRYIPADPNAREGTRPYTGYHDHSATAIRPGDYFGVVTSGAYKEIKVNAEGGAIHIGDLLVASSTPGVAMKADPKQTVFGSVIGKAMGNLESGDGTIGVMITLK